ncbi:sugar kinase [Amycolatopsis sp. YIM 10]|uniref:sugar kinase n=1 Tax=Amycolatopsis sp. YIM 10 TaxID=2653857 RepID=UPI0012906FE6|nr:sugar kinase [Amycolatopsis sp. YIM 10]QFU91648.1 2-dehydro-3-deoxygluconokinase [Amycolatopsis sp. YIM 10]
MNVVTLGETMALLSTPPWGRVTGGSALPVGIGGAESNVAIGLARLGVGSTWISRVGEDALGELVTREIRAEGVRVLAGTDAEAPTGLMLKELRDGKPRRVRYYRRGSAASRLSRSDIDPGVIQRADVVHLTGITAALGPGPRGVLHHVIELARDGGTLVSFDVNHRATLWTDEEARPELAGLAAAADLVFAGPEEAALILGRDPSGEPTFALGEQLARELADTGRGTVVIKLGELGSLALDDGQVHRADAVPVTVLDPVGAGDAFVAGYLSSLVAGEPVSERLRTGNAAGAAVCRVPGDWEGLPSREDLRDQTAVEVVR